MTVPGWVQREGLWRWLSPVLLLAIATVPFVPAIDGAFLDWDDRQNFVENLAYRGLGRANLTWMWTTFHMGHYIPMTWMSLGLDYVLHGMNARGYHLTSIALHGVNALLVYGIALRLLSWTRPDTPWVRRAAGAAIAAALFAIHPLRVESVAWITERRDVLSLAFFLAATLLYISHAGSPPRRGAYLAALACFGCALLSKGSTVTLPGLLLVLNVFPFGRLGGAAGWRGASARRVYIELFPFALLAAGFSALSMLALDPGRQLAPVQKLAVSAFSLCWYLLKTVIPTGLSPLYPMPARVDVLEARFLLSMLAVLALGLALWRLRQRAPAVVACFVAFGLIALPTLGVVQNGPQIAADRYTYHASPALALLAGVVWARRPWSWRMIAATATGLAVSGALTWQQSGYWRSSERLWTRVLEVEPDASLARTALANELVRQGRPAEAIPHFRASLASDSLSAEAENNLGIALQQTGDVAAAVTHFRRAIALDPRHYEAHNNLGGALGALGFHDEALGHFRAALAIRPDFVNAHVNWGNLLVRLGRPREALQHYERAAQLDPHSFATELNWGVALAQQGNMTGAVEHFRRAQTIDPFNPEVRVYLERASRLARP